MDFDRRSNLIIVGLSLLYLLLSCSCWLQVRLLTIVPTSIGSAGMSPSERALLIEAGRELLMVAKGVLSPVKGPHFIFELPLQRNCHRMGFRYVISLRQHTFRYHARFHSLGCRVSYSSVECGRAVSFGSVSVACSHWVR